MLEIDRETTERIARKIKPIRRQCWHNSIRAMKELPDDALYIEGWAVRNDGWIMEHGWNSLHNKIIDVTFSRFAISATIGATKEVEVFEYFPAIVFTRAEVAEHFPKFRVPARFEMPIFKRYESSNAADKERYQHAWEDVLRAAEVLIDL